MIRIWRGCIKACDKDIVNNKLFLLFTISADRSRKCGVNKNREQKIRNCEDNEQLRIEDYDGGNEQRDGTDKRTDIGV